MSQEELIFLIFVTVIMPVVMLKIILNYQKDRLKAKGAQADKSLTTSELNDLIDESVIEATAPLNDRVNELEQRMRLLDPARPTIQDELGEAEEAPAKTLGKTRS